MSRRPIRFARRLIPVALVALLAPLALAGPASAAQQTAPTSITAVAATDPSLAGQVPDVPGSTPAVFAAVGTPFQVTVTLHGDGGLATYNTDTAVVIAAPGPGVLSTTQATIPAGESSVAISTSYSAAATGLVVTATTTNKRAVLTASTNAFPVELTLNLLDGGSASLLAGTAGADGNGCATVDAAHPMCGVVRLPSGAIGTVAFSLGLCPTQDACVPGGLVTQFLADMPVASRENPASMTIVCDKSLCGQDGVTKFTAMWAQDATSALAPAPACAAKGTVGAAQEFCVDYVSSTRDRAGDLRLVVLFLKDLRGSIK